MQKILAHKYAFLILIAYNWEMGTTFLQSNEDKNSSKSILRQELRGGRYRTCLWWNNYSMQCRSSKKWVMVFAWRAVYARFHSNRHRCCRDMHFNSRLDIKFGQSQWRSSALSHSKWFLSVSRAIAMHILPPITAAEKCTLFLDST